MRSALLFLLVAQILQAQVPGGHALVATELVGNPKTQLLDVDLASGTWSPLGGFPSDNLAPEALAIDPVNLDVLLALHAGGTTAQLVRLSLNGPAVVSERLLASLSGTVTSLEILDDGTIFCTLLGANPGLWKIPRNGGFSSLAISLPGLVGLVGFGLGTQQVTLGQTGVSAPPGMDPSLHLANVSSGFVVSSHSFPGPLPLEITSFTEIPTAIPRDLFAHPDGTISLSVFQAPRTTLATTPQLPPGSTEVMRAAPFPTTLLVLGNGAHPWLKSLLPLGTPPLPWAFVAGPFPGHPRDFVIAQADLARTLYFGQSCGHVGPLPMRIWTGQGPRLGNANYSLWVVDALPLVPATLALGLSESLALSLFPLPFTLPNGCDWLVDPLLTFSATPAANGQVEVVLPIPNLPSLAGAIGFAQWIQPQGNGFAVSNAAAIHIWPL